MASAATRTILVTGANKGIGFAIVNRCLQDHPDTHLVMACRSVDRGEAAAKELIANQPEWEQRIFVLEMDTSSEESVRSAVGKLQEKFQNKNFTLYGIVNNAGVAGPTLDDILNVNVYGPKRVNDAFLPFVDPEKGRIVNMSSAAASSCVQKSSEERQKFFTNPNVTWEEINNLLEQVRQTNRHGKHIEKELGIGSTMGMYGLSKACLNCYTMYLAKQHPKLCINACTPGMIATDIVNTFVPWWVPIPTIVLKLGVKAFMGGKTPNEGKLSTMYLLFSNDDFLKGGNGWYYGSDAKRSPLDKYRSPGSPPYKG